MATSVSSLRPIDGAGDGARLKLLRGFELAHAGRPVELPLSAQRLLAFLAVQDAPVRRSYVAGSLWLESSEERACASLRSALWRLHGCGLQLVRSLRGQLSLDPDVAVDFREVEASARRALDGSAAEALDIEPSVLGADLLPDWYDEWLLLERERFRQLRLRALESLCARLTRAGCLDAALEMGLAAVADDPLRESSHRAVIGVHLADGNIAEAVRQYRLCRGLLHDRLGAKPSRQLEELIRPVSTSLW